MIVRSVSLRNYRSYAALDLALAPGLVLVCGPNGVGKTNLLESLHVATQGFSPRTHHDAQLIRFGEDAGRIALNGERSGVQTELTVILRANQAKEARLNGARLPSAESLRREVSTLVFTPDRLAVVKGGPAARRAYFDRVLGRLFPARAPLPQDYLAALAQRNAALRRVQFDASSRDAVTPWTHQVADLGASLVHARTETLASLTQSFAERAGELGLAEANLAYDGEAPTLDELEQRLARDLERGSTGAGPHLHDVLIASGDRDLRRFGSQGEQRLAVLSLLLAEAELLDPPPLLLLDDVLSELDPGRRELLATRLQTSAQAMVTATHKGSLPIEPAQLVEVTPGAAK
ncbi:MAG TPA: DNA replication and repair protein RecF [Gaiellaceae bacterium]|nr:DNA replication and repair protein RecF [Gaiellaceae bacterium]